MRYAVRNGRWRYVVRNGLACGKRSWIIGVSLIQQTERTVVQQFFLSLGNRLCRLDLAPDGAMREVDSLDMPCNIQYACADAARGLLYVICSNGGVASRGDTHWLMTVAVRDAAMRLVGESIALRYRPIHVALDRAGHQLLVAYNLPAAVTVHALDDAGRVSEFVAAAEGQDLVGWFPHQVLPMPGMDAMLLTCRGDDATADRPENPGSLRVLRVSRSQPRDATLVQVVAPRGGLGFGPRNCGFHPTAPWLYAVLERQNGLAWFRLRPDGIAPELRGTVTLLERPESLVRPQLGGALAMHPSGRFAYAVNRSHAVMPDGDQFVWAGAENSIAVFGLDIETGAPQLLQHAPLAGLHARCIDLAHGGHLLVAAIRQPSARRVGHGIESCPAGLSVFRVAADGRLSLQRHHPIDVAGHQIFWAGAMPDATSTG